MLNHNGSHLSIMISFTPSYRGIAAFLILQTAHAFQPCPLLGPNYPAPSSLSTSPIMKSALAKLTETLDKTIATGNTSDNGPVYPKTTSFSISLFSSENGSSQPDKPYFFDYHHTAPSLAKSPSGVDSVDSNSIYRIGGLTQVFTVYAFLAGAGDTYWNEPVTKYVPELKQAASEMDAQSFPTQYVDWEEVTMGELASHMSGIGRDCKFRNSTTLFLRIGYLLPTDGNADLLSKSLPFAGYGFPPIKNTSGVTCGTKGLCSRSGKQVISVLLNSSSIDVWDNKLMSSRILC